MEVDEKNFIKMLKRGHEDAMDYIIDNYFPLVKKTVYSVLGPFHDDGYTEECINDVFLSVWSKASKFQGNATNFNRWIFAVAKFKAIDFYRKKVKNAKMFLETIEVSDENFVENEIINKENVYEVLQLINGMEVIDREIFILKFFLGYKVDEIAKKLNTTKSSVYARVNKGKKKLKQKALRIKLGVV